MLSRISRGALRNGPELSAEFIAADGWGFGTEFVAVGGSLPIFEVWLFTERRLRFSAAVRIKSQ